MTGGGVVDHRQDQTYSLIIPRGHPLAEARGAESYRIIHEAVAQALTTAGTPARLVSEDGAGDSAACFKRPVAWDVVGEDGRKLAGGGQKRTRAGLLHQGSVVKGGAIQLSWAEAFTDCPDTWLPGAEIFDAARAESRYASPEWLAGSPWT